MVTFCPICGEKDVIQKVTAVVSAGQTSGSFSGPTGGVTYSGGKLGVVGGYTRLSGNTQSDLARMLAPPARPKIYTKEEIASFQVLLLLFGFIFGQGGLYMFFIGLGGFFLTPRLPAGANLLFLFMGGSLLYLFKKGMDKLDRMRRAEKGPKFQAQIKAWEELLAIRERLYYCFRDDIVFDPKTRRTCNPGEMGKFLSFLANHGL